MCLLPHSFVPAPQSWHPSQFWSRSKGPFHVHSAHVCGPSASVWQDRPMLLCISLPFGTLPGSRQLGWVEVAGPQMKSQPSFDHQLAEDRLRAPRGEMNAGNSLPPHCTLPQLWSSSQTPRKAKEGQRCSMGPTRWTQREACAV